MGQKGGAFTAGKKVNPRNRPCTHADLKKAKNDATDRAIKHIVKIVLYIMLDKHGATPEEVQKFSDEINWLSAHICSGKISWGDIDRVLDEYKIDIEWRLK